MPTDDTCAVWVDGEVEYHETGKIVVFDDSKLHKAYNESDETRIVLIVDLARPEGMLPGCARGTMTPELTNLIEFFS